MLWAGEWEIPTLSRTTCSCLIKESNFSGSQGIAVSSVVSNSKLLFCWSIFTVCLLLPFVHRMYQLPHWTQGNIWIWPLKHRSFSRVALRFCKYLLMCLDWLGELEIYNVAWAVNNSQCSSILSETEIETSQRAFQQHWGTLLKIKIIVRDGMRGVRRANFFHHIS